MTEVCYAALHEVMSALDVPETSRASAQIMREIQGSSRGIEGDTLRRFYPLVATHTFDWPDEQFSAPWRLWLNQWELTQMTRVTTAGIDITGSVLLRPDDARLRGLPYTKIEIDLSSNAAFQAGNTWQRSISVTGTFGYCDGDRAVGTVSAFADTAGTTAVVSDSSQVGAGSLIRVDTERMNVTARSYVTTGLTTTGGTLAAQNSANLVPLSGASVSAGETLLVDAEKMLITDVVGDAALVIRAWDGTALAQHAGGTTVYAPRQITVERGVLGTTAATHSANATVHLHLVPPLIRDLCIAETLNTLTQSRRGYTQIVKRSASGSSSGPGDPLEVATALDDLRTRVCQRYARGIRTRTAARVM